VTSPPEVSYTCPYCRLASEAAGPACPHCGAPTDVRERITSSGWVEQPPIRDMARIRFSRSTCQISGVYVPVAEMKLDAGDLVYFSHHALLHAEPGVTLDTRQMPDGWRRLRAGQPLIWMTAQGPGHLALSADEPGETIAVPIRPGHPVDVLEHRFLTATGNVDYEWRTAEFWFASQVKSSAKVLHYPVGQYVDRFSAEGDPGLLLLHAPGNVFVRDLADAEEILIQPRSLIWKDQSVHMSLRTEHSAGGRGSHMWLRLRGPGRVAMQSVYELVWWSGHIVDSSPRTWKSW
jgi:uncharacterized protein (AIM24 family)